MQIIISLAEVRLFYKKTRILSERFGRTTVGLDWLQKMYSKVHLEWKSNKNMGNEFKRDVVLKIKCK